MRYRQLGRTGLTVSEIGFGAWGIGGNVGGAIAYGPTDDRQSEAALLRAFEVGITFYDTSDLYGHGHSETLIGRVFKDIRSKVVVATKLGFVDSNGEQDFSPSYIRKSIERSLTRLNSDYLDLYQLHSPPLALLEQDDKIFSTLIALRSEKLVRAVGVSVRSPDDGLKVIERFDFECVQVNFNLSDQRAIDNGLLDLCEKRGVAVVIRTPLSFGFLTGHYSEKDSFDRSDHRSKWSPDQIKKWSDAQYLFHDAVINSTKQTPAQIALRFCISHPAVSTVIPGMLLKEHVEENVLASDLGVLSKVEIDEIRKIYRENQFFVRS